MTNVGEPLEQPPTHSPLATAAPEAVYARYCAERKQEDFEILVNKYQNLVYRIVYGVSGSFAQAEDATQETFLQVSTGNLSFESRGEGSFRAWLCMLALNVARAQVRSERRRTRRNQISHERKEASAVQNLSSPRELDPRLCKDEDLEHLRHALSGLSEDTRIPIILHFQEQMSQADIGKLIGVTQAQVSRRIASGLQLLRKRLEALGMTAVTISAMLKHSDLVTSPINLCSQEALRQVQQQFSTEVARQFVRKGVLGRLDAKVVVITMLLAGAASIAWVFAQGRFFNTPPSIPTVSQSPARYVWTFDKPDLPSQIKPVIGTYRWIDAASNSGLFGLESNPDTFCLEIDVPLQDRLYKMTVSTRFMRPSGGNVQTGFIGGGLAPRGPIAMFRNAGDYPEVLSASTYLKSADGKFNNEVFASRDLATYFGKDCLDYWNGSVRTGFSFAQRMPDSRIRLYVRGPYLIEKIVLAEIQVQDLPDHSRFQAAIDQIAPEHRVGTVSTDLIPAKRGNAPVSIEFAP